MKKSYIVRLERWARWMLPRQEADDVIADYRDIVGSPPRPQEELVQDLGRPRDVVRQLTTRRAYRTWLAVFAVMSVCILVPGISPTLIGYPIWLHLFDNGPGYPYGALFTIPGAVLALVWFRRQGRKEQRLPRAVPVLLAVFLACIGGVLLFCWACSRDFEGFLDAWGRMKVWLGPNEDAPRSFHLSRLAMCYGSPIIAVLGTYSLVKARTGDRRWAAVYVLGVTAMVTALMVLCFSGRIAYDGVEEAFRQMLTRCSIISAAGIVGTGVALC